MDGDEQQPDDFKIKGAASKAPETNRTHAPDTCTICLEPITERAVAAPCNHLTFDFLCLVSWLQEQSTCPLCKAKVTEVQYDWRSPDDYKTYHVPVDEQPNKKSNVDRSGQWQRRRYALPRRNAPTSSSSAGLGQDPSLERRREIYRHRLYSLHIGTNSYSQHHTFTPQDFRASQTLQSRAKMFLLRELQVFPFLSGNRDFLIEYIVAILRNHELRGADGKAEDLLEGFFGLENTRQLLHELGAWLKSPFERLAGWDACVQYKDQGQIAKGP